MVNNSTCIKLKTTDQELTVVHQPVLASGDVGTTRVEYELDSFWDGYALTGTFYTSRLPSEVYEQPLTAGACVIPWEVLQDPDILYIGLRGVNGDGLVKTAAPVRYRIIKGSPCGTDTPMEPTPDVYQQLLAKTDTLERVVEESTIVCESSGETVTITDASDQPLRGLKLYGKSVQNGTPTPENPVEIENAVVSKVGSVGANLIPFPYYNYSKDINGITWTVNADGSITANGTASATSTLYLTDPFYNRISLPSGEYFFKCNDEYQFSYYGRVAIERIDGSLVDATADNNGVKFTLNDGDVFYILLRVNSGATVSNVIFKPMLNKGTTALPYEPYKGGTATLAQPVTLPGIPVSSGGNYTDANGQQWICDEMDFARGVKVQRVGKVDLGTLSWTKNAGIHFYSSSIPATAVNFSENVMCTAYKVSPKGAYDSDIDKLVSVDSVRVWITDSSADDATSLKASLQGVMLYYELETPVETQISETDLTAYRTLHTNKLNTTVYTDSNAGVTVAYAADTKTYIDNKFAELAAAVLQNA